MNNAKGGLPPLCGADLALLRSHLEGLGLPAQVEAITAADALTVVSAGAGTGKTWTLAWRFVWTALTREDVRRILTLTFTEKAAAEMRSRIGALFQELEPVLAGSEELSRRRAEALALLDQAYISTIHGFSTRVIGEAGLLLPIEPSVRLISDPEAEEFWRELTGALDRLDADWFCWGVPSQFSSLAREILECPDTADVMNCWGPATAAAFARNFEGMMSDFGETPESILKKADGDAGEVLEELKRIMDREFMQLANCWTDALEVDPEEFGTGKFANNFAALRSRWLQNPPEGSDVTMRFVLDAADAANGARGKLADRLAEIMGVKLTDWRKRAEDLRPLSRPLLQGWNGEELRLRRDLIRCAWLCWMKWRAWKDSRGGITFSDMIALAGQALEKDEGYASRFTEVLVDEFQDTNDQQDRLIRVIRRAAKARLFTVGDLKQSIYRFRHAEPSLFERYIAEAQGGGGRYVPLNISFRSGESVLDAVNLRFSKNWKEGLGEGLKQRYEPLESPRGLERAAGWIDERQKTSVPACLRVIEDFRRDGEGKILETTAQVRNRLAARVAEELSRLRDGGAQVWGKEGPRPMRWGDAAVLTPTRSSYGSLRDAFSRWGIPAAFIGNQSFYARTEIRDACALVGFLADNKDRRSLAGFLCSPFSGLPQREAQDLLAGLDAGDPLSTLRQAYPELAARLERWSRQAMLKGASSVLSALLADGELLRGLHPRKRAGAVANLRRALSILDDYERSVGRPPVGVAAYLQHALKESRVNPEASAEADDDAVKVMTIHASKGLEFPFVVLFGIEHGGRERGGEGLRPSRRLLAAASKVPEPWGKAECLLGQAHKRLEEREEYEELQRLYYVAMTRARDGLLLCGVMPRGMGKGYSPEGDRSMLSIEYAAGEFQPTIQDAEPSRSVRPEETALAGADVRQMAGRPHSLFSVSATSHSLWTQCPAAWRMAYRQNLDLSWNVGGASGDLVESAGGADLGNVAHWILSKWKFTDLDYLRILELQDGHLRPEFRRVWRDPKAKEELRSFRAGFHTPEGERLLARLCAAEEAGTLRREFPFQVPLGPVNLAGAVDAFWTEDDGKGRPVRLCVRDYKTTRKSSSDAHQRWMDDFYAEQLRFYALALRRLYPQYAGLELDLGLWYLRSGSEHSLRAFSAGEEQELERLLTAQAAQAAEGPWPPNFSRCEGCAYERGCIFKAGK